MTPPTLHDVYAARERVAPHVPRSPLLRHPLLDEATGPVDLGEARESQSDLRLQGARRPEPGRRDDRRGTRAAASSPPAPAITASRSAWRRASTACSARCSCPTATTRTRTPRCAPTARPSKRAARISTRRASAAKRARAETGARYVHSADEPLLIAGVGTYALEVFEELPNADVIFVPLGGGSGACGLITVRNALGSKAKIIGVGAVNADAVYRSWKGPAARRRRFRQHLRRRHRHARQLRFAVQHLQDSISMTSCS